MPVNTKSKKVYSLRSGRQEIVSVEVETIDELAPLVKLDKSWLHSLATRRLRRIVPKVSFATATAVL